MLYTGGAWRGVPRPAIPPPYLPMRTPSFSRAHTARNDGPRKTKGIKKGASLGKTLRSRAFCPDILSDYRRLFALARAWHTGRGHRSKGNCRRAVRRLLDFLRQVEHDARRVLRYPIIICRKLPANHGDGQRQCRADSVPACRRQLLQNALVPQDRFHYILRVILSIYSRCRCGFCRAISTGQHANDHCPLFVRRRGR